MGLRSCPCGPSGPGIARHETVRAALSHGVPLQFLPVPSRLDVDIHELCGAVSSVHASLEEALDWLRRNVQELIEE